MPEVNGASGGVAISPVRHSDRDALLAWRNDPSAYCWYLVAAPVTEEAHDAWLPGGSHANPMPVGRGPRR